eukprot:TRINITY_DN49043_c0_g1_i1.p1 TRINITY_DN49043_c0_g1~~TRINITY_DN49043_c0_g1_i1.p1  ORF type:complete len:131 (+),score=30.57 TRINITY_DN49043_c0_g1_i1:63-455(+)
MAQTSVTFQGKTLELFTETQLLSLKREALVQRGMALRDAIGQDQLPAMPRQQEALTDWILNVQSALTRGGAPASYEGDSQAGSADGRYSAPASVRDDLSESQQAYVDAQKAKNAARERNCGSGMAGIFGS